MGRAERRFFPSALDDLCADADQPQNVPTHYKTTGAHPRSQPLRGWAPLLEKEGLETLRRLRALHQSALMEVRNTEACMWDRCGGRDVYVWTGGTRAVCMCVCVGRTVVNNLPPSSYERPTKKKHYHHNNQQVATARVAALTELEQKGEDDALLFRFPPPQTFALRVVRDEGAMVRAVVVDAVFVVSCKCRGWCQ